jgi:prepilin-type N-terminal cleavage/methylation domain-containing protein
MLKKNTTTINQTMNDEGHKTLRINHRVSGEHDYSHAQSGFTLVEVSISLVILSFLMVVGTLMIPRYAAEFQKDSVLGKMDVVHRAISVYAQKNNRIPCPADPNPVIATQPYGTERGSGVNGQNPGTCDLNNTARHGIIPWRTLGLNFEDVFDGYGNMMTYRVSASPTNTPNAGTDFINNWCRTQPKWNIATTGLDADKASFCCGHLPTAAIATWLGRDTQVEGAFGPLPASTRNINNYGGTIAEYSQDGNAIPTAATLQNTFRPSFAAYTLISHGRNGAGSYTSTGLQNTRAFLSVREQDNATPTLNTTYIPDNTTDTPNAGDPGPGTKSRLDISQIDDVVSWRTPMQIYGLVGRGSCTEARQ